MTATTLIPASEQYKLVLRGTLEWAEREAKRALKGCVCVSPHAIPTGQAHGELNAHLQQIDTSMYKGSVQEMLRDRNVQRKN